MGHGHSHDCGHHHHHDVRQQNRKRLLCAALITGGVCVAEVIGGWMSNSLALLADAGHVLTDLAALVLSIIAMRLAERPPTSRKTYGYRHAEIIAAFVNALVVMALSLVIVWEAIARLRAPEPVSGGLMLVITLAGMAGNIASAVLLFHGQRTSLNVRGAFLHVIGDLLGSLAALIAAAGIFLFGTTVLDPVASIVVSALILTSAWSLARHSGALLMLSVPPHIAFEEVARSLSEIPSVTRLHDLHVWSIGEGAVALSCHIVVDDGADRTALLSAAQDILRKRFSISHSVIQIESAHANCPVETTCFVP